MIHGHNAGKLADIVFFVNLIIDGYSNYFQFVDIAP